MALGHFFKKAAQVDSPIIEFYCEERMFGVIPEPQPAIKLVPDWFKAIKPQVADGGRDQFGGNGFTAKKCMPLVDSMSLGFIIPLWADVNIRVSDDGKLIDASRNPMCQEWGTSVVEFHGPHQLGGPANPVTGKANAVKFINHWVVKTAPGYSCLFVPAINQLEKRFTLFSGLVDTDSYPKQVNFPGVWNIPGFDDVVPAGTPLVTCIPIRRADWVREAPVRAMSELEVLEITKLRQRQDSRRSVYSKELREPRK